MVSGETKIIILIPVDYLYDILYYIIAILYRYVSMSRGYAMLAHARVKVTRVWSDFSKRNYYYNIVLGIRVVGFRFYPAQIKIRELSIAQYTTPHLHVWLDRITIIIIYLPIIIIIRIPFYGPLSFSFAFSSARSCPLLADCQTRNIVVWPVVPI